MVFVRNLLILSFSDITYYLPQLRINEILQIKKVWWVTKLNSAFQIFKQACCRQWFGSPVFSDPFLHTRRVLSILVNHIAFFLNAISTKSTSVLVSF